MAEGGLTITIDQHDWQKMQTALDALENIEQQAAIQRGLQEGLRIISNQGKTNLKNRLSTEAWNITMRNRMASKRGGGLQNAFSTQIKKKKGKGYAGFTNKGHHAHLVDRGTAKRWTKKGAYRGSVSKGNANQGNMFWTDAFRTEKDKAGQALMDTVYTCINQIIERNS